MSDRNKFKLAGIALTATLSLGLSGCATTTGNNAGSDSRDPLETWNRDFQSFNDTVDKNVVKPVAKGYQWAIPNFVNSGISNFFSNVGDIGVTINDLLQFKVQQGGSDGIRFLANSTIGLAGLFDVATPMGLPKHNEDFAQTLGAWGVPTGPYFIIPFLGPSTPRGLTGLVADAALNPISYIGLDLIRYGLSGLKLIDVRADHLSTSKIADEAALDRYEFIRNAYLQRRNYLVYDGNPPLNEDEFFDEEEFMMDEDE